MRWPIASDTNEKRLRLLRDVNTYHQGSRDNTDPDYSERRRSISAPFPAANDDCRSLGFARTSSGTFPPSTTSENERKRRRLASHNETPTFDEFFRPETEYRHQARDTRAYAYYPQPQPQPQPTSSSEMYNSYLASLEHAPLQNFENRPPVIGNRQGSTASAQSLLGDVAEGMNEFDLFNGELLDSDQDEPRVGRPRLGPSARRPF
jgi:hypothetical protein